MTGCNKASAQQMQHTCSFLPPSQLLVWSAWSWTSSLALFFLEKNQPLASRASSPTSLRVLPVGAAVNLRHSSSRHTCR